MNSDFRSAVAKAFAPLAAEFGLRTLREEDDRFGSEVIIGNTTTALLLRLEPREGLFASLLRLRDAMIPSRDIWDRMRDPINGFDVDDLIQLRAAEFKVHREVPLSGPKVEVALCAYAVFLMENGRDVLSGDFKVFADLTRIVATRIRCDQREGRTVGPDSVRFLEAAEQLEKPT